jgi:hypothetical protein
MTNNETVNFYFSREAAQKYGYNTIKFSDGKEIIYTTINKPESNPLVYGWADKKIVFTTTNEEFEKSINTIKQFEGEYSQKSTYLKEKGNPFLLKVGSNLELSGSTIHDFNEGNNTLFSKVLKDGGFKLSDSSKKAITKIIKIKTDDKPSKTDNKHKP